MNVLEFVLLIVGLVLKFGVEIIVNFDLWVVNFFLVGWMNNWCINKLCYVYLLIIWIGRW